MTDSALPALHGKGVAIAATSELAEALGRRLERRGATVALCSPAPDEAAVEAAFDRILQALPRLDSLVVAPPQPAARGLLETDLAGWDEALATTLRVTFLLSRRAIEEWLASAGGGRIVLVAPAADEGATAAAVQAALLSLARSLTKEYGGRGIVCNAVVRGSGAPLLDAGLAEAILFLASEEASYVSGEAFFVSGGVLSSRK